MELTQTHSRTPSNDVETPLDPSANSLIPFRSLLTPADPSKTPPGTPQSFRGLETPNPKPAEPSPLLITPGTAGASFPGSAENGPGGSGRGLVGQEGSGAETPPKTPPPRGILGDAEGSGLGPEGSEGSEGEEVPLKGVSRGSEGGPGRGPRGGLDEEAGGSEGGSEGGSGGVQEEEEVPKKKGWYRESKMWILLGGSSLIVMLFNYVDELTPIMVKF